LATRQFLDSFSTIAVFECALYQPFHKYQSLYTNTRP